jgi:hypothetical protein
MNEKLRIALLKGVTEQAQKINLELKNSGKEGDQTDASSCKSEPWKVGLQDREGF